MVQISDMIDETSHCLECPEKKEKDAKLARKRRREGNVGGETKKGRNAKKNKGM